MTYSRSTAVSMVNDLVAAITDPASDPLTIGAARRDLKKATTDPRMELAWPEAAEALAMVTVSKPTKSAELTLRPCDEPETEGHGGKWLPTWKSPMGRLRGLRLAFAIMREAGFVMATAADGTVTLTPGPTTWCDQTVGEQLQAGKR